MFERTALVLATLVGATLFSPAAPAQTARIEARAEARTALIEIDEGGKTQRIRLALDGRNTSSIDLDNGASEYHLSVRKEVDDGKAVVLQLSFARKRRTADHVASAQLSVRKRLAIGKRAVMIAVEGDEALRVSATLQ